MISYPLLLRKTSSSSPFLGNGASSSVAMVSSLHPTKMNCSRIFNLFCLYGNVEKVCACPGYTDRDEVRCLLRLLL